MAIDHGWIYLIAHKESGKGYVGQTRQGPRIRWLAHCNRALAAEGRSYATRTAITRAMRKHGVESFEFDILEECPAVDLDGREAHWIAKLGTLVPAGYNLTEGGNTSRRSADVAARISAANKGRIKDAEWRSRLSASHTGKILSAEHKAKISAVQMGRKQSAETNAKRSVALKGKPIGPHSPERRAAIAAGMTEAGKIRSKLSHLGVKRSDETKQKMREVWARRKETANIISVVG